MWKILSVACLFWALPSQSVLRYDVPRECEAIYFMACLHESTSLTLLIGSGRKHRSLGCKAWRRRPLSHGYCRRCLQTASHPLASANAPHAACSTCSGTSQHARKMRADPSEYNRAARQGAQLTRGPPAQAASHGLWQHAGGSQGRASDRAGRRLKTQRLRYLAASSKLSTRSGTSAHSTAHARVS